MCKHIQSRPEFYASVFKDVDPNASIATQRKISCKLINKDLY